MAVRSYSDVPNRTIQIFLQEAGVMYDRARGLEPFRRIDDTLGFFEHACAYCGIEGAELVEEHVIPRNRAGVGLHAWGNVVPACRNCNRQKGGRLGWDDFLRSLVGDAEVAESRVQKIEAFQTAYRYAPNTAALGAILNSLYNLVDVQTRGLVRFAVEASAAVLADMHPSAPT